MRILSILSFTYARIRLAFSWFLAEYFYCILCALPLYIVLLLSVVFYTVVCELRLI